MWAYSESRDGWVGQFLGIVEFFFFFFFSYVLVTSLLGRRLCCHVRLRRGAATGRLGFPVFAAAERLENIKGWSSKNRFLSLGYCFFWVGA
jgi:hypothetical protein